MSGLLARAAWLGAVLPAAAACGPASTGSGAAASDPSGKAADPPEASPSGWWSAGPVGDTARYRGIGTVLDDGDGPELCLGPIMSSLPPQCGGPRLVGWDWSGIESAQRAGVRWTVPEYVVTGSYGDHTLTLTEPPVRSDEYDGPRSRRSYDEDRSFATPCPEPPGGWRPVDPGRTTHRALQEQRLREVWGGALCVTRAERTAAELRRIQDEVARTPGMISASSGQDVVALDVELDDGPLQRRFDERYGEGVVRVHSALFPVSPGD